MAGIDEPFRTLFCDPGEDFGWCLGRGTTLLAGGTEKMHAFHNEIWDALMDPGMPSYLTDPDCPFMRDEVIAAGLEAQRSEEECRIGRIVIEDWRLYPWETRAGHLDWDPCRTARVIGKIELMCEKAGVELIYQGANIKKAAQSAGAEELYWHPLHENRHQNDAAQHFVFFTCTRLLGLHMPIPGDER